MAVPSLGGEGQGEGERQTTLRRVLTIDAQLTNYVLHSFRCVINLEYPKNHK
jgi:hypothetical protein